MGPPPPVRDTSHTPVPVFDASKQEKKRGLRRSCAPFPSHGPAHLLVAYLPFFPFLQILFLVQLSHILLVYTPFIILTLSIHRITLADRPVAPWRLPSAFFRWSRGVEKAAEDPSIALDQRPGAVMRPIGFATFLPTSVAGVDFPHRT
ncbi:hypothetical protein NDU88_006729 [Pleurodeles waltl]|uniref:Uncharacterized protein n=1 Tax=Pleurodeles waltl TaxID=8319 RepID=A0AAV7TXW1_PLEWA|nr:hypothetical protein NDU88_006729 [Pleurodeles waltl]